MDRPTRLARRVQLLLGCSFSRARHEVEVGHVLVSGAVVADPGALVGAGDAVEHNPHLPKRRRAPETAPIHVLHLDEDVVVVEKPPGVVVHPTLDEEADTVLARVGAAVERIAGSHRRVLVVHRLDRDTSGVMVFALTHQAAEHLHAQLKVHRMERRYLALAAGDLAEPSTVDRSIGRPRPGARRAALGPGLGGQTAQTLFEPVERLGGATLVEATLGTGRTHQVRVHLSYLGHPVLGDPVYGDPRQDPIPAPRLALHAAVLGFVHPRTGARLRFTSPLPPDLERVVRALRRRLPHALPLRPAHPAPPGGEAASPPPHRRTPHPRVGREGPTQGAPVSRRRPARPRRPR